MPPIKTLVWIIWLYSFNLAMSQSLAGESDAITYQVMQVYDGDTVRLRALKNSFDDDSKLANPPHDLKLQNFKSQDFKLRLTDIDAPERTQSYGQKAKRALSKLCKGENIVVMAQMSGTDKYGRTLGKLNCNAVDASLYLVQHGLAWHNEKYSSDPVIAHAALGARERQLGLWKNSKPTPPWVWRKQHPQQY